MAKRITADKGKKSATPKVKARQFSAHPATAKVLTVRAVKTPSSNTNQGGNCTKNLETSTLSTADNVKHRVTQLQLQLDNHALQQAAQRQAQEVALQQQQLARARSIVAQHEDNVRSQKFAPKTLREIREVTENYVAQFEAQMLAGLDNQYDPALITTFHQDALDRGQQEFNETLYSLYDEQGRNPNYMGGYVLPTTTKKRLRGETQVFATQRQIQNPVYHYNTQAALVSDRQAYYAMCGQAEQTPNQGEIPNAIAQVRQFARPAYGSTVGINGHQQNHQLASLANLPLLQANHEAAVTWLLETGFMGSEQQAMQALQQRHEFQAHEQELIREGLALPANSLNLLQAATEPENSQRGAQGNALALSEAENAQAYSSEIYVRHSTEPSFNEMQASQSTALAGKNSLSASIANLKQRVLNSLETTQSQTSTTENKVVTKPSKGYQVLSHTQSLTQTRTIKQIIQQDGTVLSQVIDTNVTVESATNTLDSGELETQSTRTVEKKVTHNQQDIETILERRAIFAELNQYGTNYATQFAPYAYSHNQYPNTSENQPATGWLGRGVEETSDSAGQFSYPVASKSNSNYHPAPPYRGKPGASAALLERGNHQNNYPVAISTNYQASSAQVVPHEGRDFNDMTSRPAVANASKHRVVRGNTYPVVAPRLAQPDGFPTNAQVLSNDHRVENITLSVNPDGVWEAEAGYPNSSCTSQSKSQQEDAELEAFLEQSEMFETE